MSEMPAAASLHAKGDSDFVITANARTLERFKKIAEAGGASEQFTIESDEGPSMGGDASAPTPLAYLTAALAF